MQDAKMSQCQMAGVRFRQCQNTKVSNADNAKVREYKGVTIREFES